MPQQTVPPVREKWFTRKEAAHYLTTKGCPVAEQTLRHYASNNNALNGPRFRRFGWKSIRYLQADLDQWLEKRVRWIE